MIIRCDSAAMVLKTSELLPEPEMPVNTVSRRLGSSTLTSLRLFSRAPCTRIRSWVSAVVVSRRGLAHRDSVSGLRSWHHHDDAQSDPAVTVARLAACASRTRLGKMTRMTEFPHLLHTASTPTDCRGLAEFYRELLGLRYRPGDEPPTDGSADDADWRSSPMRTASASWPSSRSTGSSAPPGPTTTSPSRGTWT